MPDSIREDRLLILLTFIKRTPAEDSWIRENLPRINDWEGWLETASDNRVIPMIRWQLEGMGLLDQIPPGARARLDRGAEEVAAANEARLVAGREVLAALSARNVDVVVLKGVMLAEALYGNPAYKRMNDIDILIHKDALHTVYEVYEACDLFYVAERVAGDLERQASLTHHAPPFVNRSLTCMMGTQWAFKSPLLKLGFDYDAIWSRTVPFELRGVSLRRLSWEDQLHHLCVHLDRFKSGTRDLMDVFNLVHAHETDIDWARLRDDIRAAKTANYVYYALGLAQAYRPSFAVQDLLSALEGDTDPDVKSMTAWRSRSPRVLLRICSRQLSTIEKAVSEFNATQNFREKLPRFVQGWRTIIDPPVDEALRICALTEPTLANRIRARTRAPGALVRAITDEIGGLLLLGLAVKSTVDLARSALPGQRRDDLKAYADRIGVSVDELRSIAAAIE